MKTIRIPDESVQMFIHLFEEDKRTTKECTDNEEFRAKYPALTRKGEQQIEWLQFAIDQLRNK